METHETDARRMGVLESHILEIIDRQSTKDVNTGLTDRTPGIEVKWASNPTETVGSLTLAAAQGPHTTWGGVSQRCHEEAISCLIRDAKKPWTGIVNWRSWSWIRDGDSGFQR